MAFHPHSEYTHPMPDSNLLDLNAKGTCLLADGNGRRIEAHHTPVYPKPVSLQNSGTKIQNEINDPGRCRNGQSRFNDILSYRIILIDTESTHNVRKADLTGFFVLEWQQWPLKGQPRYGESVARLEFSNVGKLSLAEGRLHEWLWEPCVAESLKEFPDIGCPRIMIKERSVPNGQPQTLTNEATEEDYCIAFSIRIAAFDIRNAPVQIPANFPECIPNAIKNLWSSTSPCYTQAPLSMSAAYTPSDFAAAHLGGSGHQEGGTTSTTQPFANQEDYGAVQPKNIVTWSWIEQIPAADRAVVIELLHCLRASGIACMNDFYLKVVAKLSNQTCTDAFTAWSYIAPTSPQGYDQRDILCIILYKGDTTQLKRDLKAMEMKSIDKWLLNLCLWLRGLQYSHPSNLADFICRIPDFDHTIRARHRASALGDSLPGIQARSSAVPRLPTAQMSTSLQY